MPGSTRCSSAAVMRLRQARSRRFSSAPQTGSRPRKPLRLQAGFPVRVRIAVPPEGLGGRLDQIIAWLDANCGADGWTSAPSSTRGVVNDALAVYFLDATIASAFVARWCATQRVEILDGVYRVRDDEP